MRLNKEMRLEIRRNALVKLRTSLKTLQDKKIEQANKILKSRLDPVQKAKALIESKFGKDVAENMCSFDRGRISHNLATEEGHVYTIAGSPYGDERFCSLRSDYRTVSWSALSTTQRKQLKAYERTFQKVNALHNEIEKLSNKIDRVLMPVGSVKRLEEVWPEGKKFYKNVVPNTNKGVAIVSRKDVEAVNQELGLK